jgi:RHS repeat-associated protein
VSPVLPVNSGDYFTIRAYQNTGGVLNVAVSFSIVSVPPSGSGGTKAALLAESVLVPPGWPGANLSFATSPPFNTGGFWSAATLERFTVPTGVQYVQVLARGDFPWECSACLVYVLKNDSMTVASAYASTANTGFGGTSFTAVGPVVPVSPGDYFTVRAYQNTAGALPVPIQFSIASLDGFGGSGGLKTAVAQMSVSVPAGWGGDLPFSAVALDAGGWWSSSAPARLTVPANVGHVQVSAWINYDWTCTVCLSYVVKNNAEVVAYAYGATANTGFGGDRFTALAPVVAVQPGDYFTVRGYQNSGASLASEVNLSIFALGLPLGPGPTIMTLSPAAAGVGQSVTLTGFNFGATQGTSRVRFTGPAGPIEATVAPSGWSATSITAIVPEWAMSGNVTVRVAGQDSNGKLFTLIPSPTITAVTPSWGAAGDTVVITGANFGVGGTVTFANNQIATVTAWSATSITLTVPAAATTGGLQVGVTSTGLTSNVVPFTVGTEELLYYHSDGIGSVRMITGAAGLVLERHDYLPFGEELTATGDQAHIGFGGKEKDQETGVGSWAALNYFGARSLHAASGRFTSADPVFTIDDNLVDPQRWNRYSYARNGPLRYVDPDGRATTDATGWLVMRQSARSSLTGWLGETVGGFLADALLGGPDEIPDPVSLGAAPIRGLGKAAARRLLSESTEDIIHFHHAWPKYLGGAVQQILEPLPKRIHDQFHRGLDAILPRQAGAAYYASLPPGERRQKLRELADYVREFDTNFGTHLFDAMLREGFKIP